MPRYWILMLLTLALVIGAGTAVGGDLPPQPSAGDEPVVVRLYVRDQDHLNAVAGELDIWEVHPDELYVVAAVRPAEVAWLQTLGYRLEIDPVKTAQLGILAPLDPRYYYFDDDYYNSYNRYVVNFLQDTQAAYPDLTELIDIGDAWQATQPGYHHRDIWVLRITNEDPDLGPIEDKPVFYLFGTIHAREVAIPELAIRYIKYLTEGYDGEGGYDVDPDVTWLVNHNTLYVLVMQNPDGHRVNEGDTGAYRRKNMNNNECSWGTFGIDLNRNSSFKWGCCGGSSPDPCNETYRGPMRASEPETQAFQAHFAEVMLDQNGPNGDDELPPAAPDDATGIFISLHSYQDEILWPYGFAEGGAPNNAQLKTIGRKLAYYNGSYPSGFLYTVDGSTDDWTYGKFGVASFTFEVGPTWGTCGGFFPPYGCIDGIDGMPRDFWTENRPAFLYAHKIARTPYMTSYGPDTLDVAVTPDDVPQGTPVALTATIADHRYGADPLRPIAAAEYFINAPGADGTGIPLDPADGDWGDFTEVVEATVDTSSLAPGKHLILVHGKNDQGKWGPFSAVFVTITAGLSPEEMTLVASPLEIPIGDGEATITATLTLSDSTPIPGWVVTFTTDLGTVDPLTATSDLNGQAVTILSAGAITGTAQVTAEAAGLTESVAVEFYLPEPSVAGFTTNSPVCLCEATWFTFGGDEGRPPANEYAWWFGDGESTTVPTPDPVEHTYAAADIYSATLEVCQPGGACDSFSDWVDVRTGPVASFDYLAEGLTVTFTNSSTDADDYEWDLGDGNTSEEEHPVHVYDQGGCYTVTLTVSNMCGMDSQSEFICVCEPVGDVDFTWAPDPGMVGEPMLFTASEVSGTAPLTYTWDLGDETEMGTGITVTHVYTAEGVYAVTLWVENCGGEYQATKQHLVTVEAGILQLYVPVLLKNLGLPRLTANHQGQPISLLALLGAPSMRVGWRAQIPFES